MRSNFIPESNILWRVDCNNNKHNHAIIPPTTFDICNILHNLSVLNVNILQLQHLISFAFTALSITLPSKSSLYAEMSFKSGVKGRGNDRW